MKNYCSIQLFHQALHNTHLFASINPTSIESLCRTTHFAECRAIVNGAEVLLHAPISPEAMALAERAYAVLRGERSELIGNFRVLNNEIGGQICIIVESLPQGITLDYAMLTMSQDRLIAGLNEFRSRLRRANISHNNLRKQTATAIGTLYGYTIRPRAMVATMRVLMCCAERLSKTHHRMDAYTKRYQPTAQSISRYARAYDA